MRIRALRTLRIPQLRLELSVLVGGYAEEARNDVVRLVLVERERGAPEGQASTQHLHQCLLLLRLLPVRLLLLCLQLNRLSHCGRLLL
jgi:hypothetical protein